MGARSGLGESVPGLITAPQESLIRAAGEGTQVPCLTFTAAGNVTSWLPDRRSTSGTATSIPGRPRVWADGPPAGSGLARCHPSNRPRVGWSGSSRSRHRAPAALLSTVSTGRAQPPLIHVVGEVEGDSFGVHAERGSGELGVDGVGQVREAGPAQGTRWDAAAVQEMVT